MHILVTGAAGFIGSHLCDRLIGRGDVVVGIDNLRLGRVENLAQLLSSNRFRFVEADLLDACALESTMASAPFACAFHLAANSDIARSREDPSIDFNHTLGTTRAVLEGMRRHDISRLVFASTSAIYGDTAASVREDHGPLFPISHYGAAKLASEAFIASYVHNYGLRAWIARFPNVVGPRATHGAIYDFVAKLRRSPGRLEVLGDGTQTKPYLHVDDLLDALLLAFDNSADPINCYNIAGTTRASVRRIAEIVIEESGRDVEISYTGGDRGWPGDVPHVEYDTAKIRALGWSPRLDSESAVRAATRSALVAP